MSRTSPGSLKVSRSRFFFAFLSQHFDRHNHCQFCLIEDHSLFCHTASPPCDGHNIIANTCITSTCRLQWMTMPCSFASFFLRSFSATRSKKSCRQRECFMCSTRTLIRLARMRPLTTTRSNLMYRASNRRAKRSCWVLNTVYPLSTSKKTVLVWL